MIQFVHQRLVTRGYGVRPLIVTRGFGRGWVRAVVRRLYSVLGTQKELLSRWQTPNNCA